MTKNLVLLLDPGWIKIGIRNPGWIKIGIWDKHPESATMLFGINTGITAYSRPVGYTDLLPYRTVTLPLNLTVQSNSGG
jgi:hypothetical protein